MPIAKALMYTAGVVGLLGILSGVLLVYREVRDWWQARRTREEETPCACPRCREARAEVRYPFNRHRLTP